MAQSGLGSAGAYRVLILRPWLYICKDSASYMDWSLGLLRNLVPWAASTNSHAVTVEIMVATVPGMKRATPQILIIRHLGSPTHDGARVPRKGANWKVWHPGLGSNLPFLSSQVPEYSRRRNVFQALGPGLEGGAGWLG